MKWRGILVATLLLCGAVWFGREARGESTITITNPIEGGHYLDGALVTLRWTYSGIASTEKVNTRIDSENPPRDSSSCRWPPYVYDPDDINLPQTGKLPSVSYQATRYMIVALASNPAINDVVSFIVQDPPLVPTPAGPPPPPPAKSITVTAPNGGETLTLGVSSTIAWTSTGGITGVKIESSTDAGSTWQTIVADTANDGSYPWTAGTASTQCLVRITATDGSGAADQSNALFTVSTVAPPPPAKSITVTAPNSGETLTLGTSSPITWTSTGSIATVKIEVSTTAGSSWQTIIASTANGGSYSWTVAGAASTQCLIRITATDGSATDQSDSFFTIAAAPPPPSGAFDGFGKDATGGAGKPQVVLNNPSGSALMAALKNGNVTVKVSGSIQMPKARNTISTSNITLNGQGTTTLWGGDASQVIEFRGTNIIIQNLRIREGYDNLSLYGASKVVVNHISTSGSNDDGISCAYGSNYVTLSYNAHFGNTRSCFIKYGAPHNISLHHTFFRGQWIRGPIANEVTLLDVRNILNENWKLWGTRFEGGSTGNVVNSTYVLTAASYGRDADAYKNALYTSGAGTHYFGGNVGRGGAAPKNEGSSALAIPAAYQVVTESAAAAEANVRANAGCLPRDSIDNSYINATSWSIGSGSGWRIK